MSHSARQLLLDAAVDRAPVGMAVLDAELRYLHVNAALAAINGVSVEDHIGHSVDEVLPAEVAARVATVVREVIATGEPRNGVELRRGEPVEGQRLEASYFPIRGNGDVDAVGAVGLDVTARARPPAPAR